MADVITRFKLETTQYDSALRSASQQLREYGSRAMAAGKEFQKFTKDQAEVARSFGKIAVAAKEPKDKVKELVSAFNEAAKAYNSLTKEQQQSDWGKGLSESLQTLKVRISDAKKELYDFNQGLSGSKFGQFGGIIDGIGRKMGINANLTELLTSKTALMTAGIGAAVAAIYKGTEAWAKYNAELSRQDQQTQVITGLKGSGADHMTDVMRAISDTYNVDFRQAVEAANTLMSQFGVSGSEAIQLIRDGMQGMIQGDGPKLLSMIQQYAPAFRDAGVSASQLVAVIHNSEGGIFTDQNMSAIVMGMKNIRLMTKQTSDALSQLGIDGNQMSKQLNEGTLTVFDALKQVASELKNVDSNSKTAGEVMQTVFGRQGAMAGTNLAKAIETLNTNLEETKKQTGELGDAFVDLQEANERLNVAIRECFEYDGWEQMATGIKSNLVTALSAVLETLTSIKTTWDTLLANIGVKGNVPMGLGAFGLLTWNANKNNGTTEPPLPTSTDNLIYPRRSTTEYVNELMNSSNKQGTYEKQLLAFDTWISKNEKRIEKLSESAAFNDPSYHNLFLESQQKELSDLQQKRAEYVEQAKAIIKKVDGQNNNNNNNNNTNVNKTKTQSEQQQNEAAIAKLTEEYQNLATAAKTADDAQKAGLTEHMTAIQGEIKTLQERNAELKKFADEAKGVKVVVDVPNSLPQLTQQLKDLQQAQSQSLDTREWVEYQRQIDVTTTKIDILKGKWKEGQVATFSISTDDNNVMQKLREIEGVTIADKTLTVTANTAEAVDALRRIDGLTIQPKSVSFIADNAEVLDKLREVNGVSIDEKTLTVTANTAEAVEALRRIDGLTIQPKAVLFIADNAEVLDKLREVNGVSIDEKTLTVTANTAEAVEALRKIDWLTIQPKEVSFIADNAEVLDKLREVNGVSIDEKTLTVTANTVEAVDALRRIDGLTIQPKEVSFIADNAEVLDKLREVSGVSIDPKTLTVTANTAEAYNKVQELIGSIEGTTVSFDVKPQAKALPTLDDYRIQAMIAIDTQNTKVDTNALQTLLKDAIEKGIDTTSLNLEPIAEQIGKGIDVPDSAWEGIMDGYKDLCEEIGADPIKINLKTGGEAAEDGKAASVSWKDAAKAVQSVGQAFSQIEDPAAKVAGTLAQAIASVVLGYATATTQAAKLGPWAWVAFAASGLAQMIATISTIKSVAHYAEGGIVGGNDYTDSTPIMVSSGELILNRSQQENIASQLQEGQQTQVSSLPYVTGEKVVLGINNWARSTGRGQLVFSKGL